MASGRGIFLQATTATVSEKPWFHSWSGHGAASVAGQPACQKRDSPGHAALPGLAGVCSTATRGWCAPILPQGCCSWQRAQWGSGIPSWSLNSGCCNWPPEGFWWSPNLCAFPLESRRLWEVLAFGLTSLDHPKVGVLMPSKDVGAQWPLRGSDLTGGQWLWHWATISLLTAIVSKLLPDSGECCHLQE